MKKQTVVLVWLWWAACKDRWALFVTGVLSYQLMQISPQIILGDLYFFTFMLSFLGYSYWFFYLVSRKQLCLEGWLCFKIQSLACMCCNQFRDHSSSEFRDQHWETLTYTVPQELNAFPAMAEKGTTYTSSALGIRNSDAHERSGTKSLH